MRERDLEIAKNFGVLERVQEFEKKLLEIDHVVDVEFDLDCFLSDIRQVIFLPKYDIPVSLPDYYEVRRAMLQQVIDVANSFGLKPSGDRIEDYGEHFYIVRSCDNSWVLKQEVNYVEPELAAFIVETAREVVGEYDWTMPKYNTDEYDDYNEYDSECHDIGHERRSEICGATIRRLVEASRIPEGDESYYELIDETVWDEITNCICKNMDDKTTEKAVPKMRYFMMDAAGVDRLTIDMDENSIQYAESRFFYMFGYMPDVVKTIDSLGGTVEVIKDTRDGIDELIGDAVKRSADTKIVDVGKTDYVKE